MTPKEKRAAYQREWHRKNPGKAGEYKRRWLAKPENRERANAWNRKKTADCKALVFEHYGLDCACCGEKEPLFLTIDHINGGGTKHLRSLGRGNIHRWLVDNDFPKGFRVLCYNCNAGRHRNGGTCPHINKP